MYDVMAWRRAAATRTRSGARSATARSTARRWSSWCPRSPAREPTAGYLFYDCQTDDARLVLTVLGEAERFGAVIANRCEVTGPRGARRARGRACSCATRSAAASSRWPRDERGERHRASGRTSCARRSSTRRRRCRAIRPSRGTHVTLPRELLDVARGRDRAGRRRAHRVRAALARAARWSAPPTTTTRARSSTCRRATRTWRTCSTR